MNAAVNFDPSRVTVALPHPLRIVCIGGGTGMPVVLRGLAPRVGRAGGRPIELTAIVAMSDDGGSSGRLRRERGGLPPGDVRNCLVALAGRRGPLKDLFQYRFGGGRGLGGHTVGNLLLAAAAELEGSFLTGVELAGRLLHARGRVLPSTLRPIQLMATLDDERRVIGERNLVRAGGRVRRVSLVPRSPPPCAGALEAIAAADLIAIGPGSLYSSLLPNLLVDGIAEALRESQALKVLIGNLMTQPGETDGMTGEEHVQAILDHVGPVLDAVLINVAEPEPEQLARAAERRSKPIVFDRTKLIGMGVLPIEADLLGAGSRIRHDRNKVARSLLRLATVGP